jgi:hypothetical protein
VVDGARVRKGRVHEVALDAAGALARYRVCVRAERAAGGVEARGGLCAVGGIAVVMLAGGR